jgi:hypothetical protein
LGFGGGFLDARVLARSVADRLIHRNVMFAVPNWYDYSCDSRQQRALAVVASRPLFKPGRA